METPQKYNFHQSKRYFTREQIEILFEFPVEAADRSLASAKFYCSPSEAQIHP